MRRTRSAAARRFAGEEWWHAGRVAAGLLVPGLALLAAGRPDLIIFVAFGSFTGMYGRAETRALRFRHQAEAGAVLLSGVTVGALLSACHARPWLLVAVETAFSFACALVTIRLGLSPRGPFFGIFALGAIALVPAGRIAPSAGISLCAAAIAGCVLIGLAGPDRAPVAGPGRAECTRRCLVIHAARYAAAISAAGGAGLLLGVDHANWAMASAAVPLAATGAHGRLHPGLHSVLDRSLHRVAGTLAGLVVTAVLLLPEPGPAPLALVVIALLFPTELFMSRHYGLALGFFTPLILLMTELAAPSAPLPLLTARVTDTVVGVAAGIISAAAIRGTCRA